MDHYTPESFRLTQSVGFAINKARNLLVTEMDAALKELDITSQQMGILLSLRSGVATTPFELSKLLGIDTGLMTRMLDKLETKGLLERSRSIEDRRVVNLTLTKEGEAVAEQASGYCSGGAERASEEVHESRIRGIAPSAEQVSRRLANACWTRNAANDRSYFFTPYI